MRRHGLQLFALVFALVLAAGHAHADEGDPDLSFGGGNTGKRRLGFNYGLTVDKRRDYPSGMAVAPDGKILLAGTVTDADGDEIFGLWRLQANGASDGSFGTDNSRPGSVSRGLIADSEVGGVAVTSDGRVLVAGTSGLVGVVLRFTANGAVDDFSAVGSTEVAAIAPSGRATRFVDIAALPDGRFLAAGTISPGPGDAQRDFVVVRFLQSGAVDTSFGNGGFITAAFDMDVTKQDSAAAMAIAPSGAIVVAGTVSAGTNDVGVAVFTPAGQPDASFTGVLGAPGRTAFEFAGGANDRGVDVAVDSLGRIVVVATTNAGGSDVMGVARLTPQGQPDPTFGPLGRRTLGLFFDPVRAGAVAVDAQRRVYVVGAADLIDAGEGPRQVFGRRFREDGTADTAYNDLFYGHEFDATGRDDIGVAAVLQNDRLVVLAAAQASSVDFDFGVARFQSSVIFGSGFE